MFLKETHLSLSEILLSICSEVCWTENRVMAMSNAKGRVKEGIQQDDWREFAEEAGIQPVHTHLQLAVRETLAPNSYCSNPWVF